MHFKVFRGGSSLPEGVPWCSGSVPGVFLGVPGVFRDVPGFTDTPYDSVTYDPVNTRLSESEAEAEEQTNHDAWERVI